MARVARMERSTGAGFALGFGSASVSVKGYNFSAEFGSALSGASPVISDESDSVSLSLD